MNKYIVEMVKTSKWLKSYACDFMELRLSTPIHVVLERIWLNVSASFGVKWQQVEHATENETKLYAAKIITLLLIMSQLKAINKLNDEDISYIIGLENRELIDEYFDYIEGKKT